MTTSHEAWSTNIKIKTKKYRQKQKNKQNKGSQCIQRALTLVDVYQMLNSAPPPPWRVYSGVFPAQHHWLISSEPETDNIIFKKPPSISPRTKIESQHLLRMCSVDCNWGSSYVCYDGPENEMFRRTSNSCNLLLRVWIVFSLSSTCARLSCSSVCRSWVACLWLDTTSLALTWVSSSCSFCANRAWKTEQCLSPSANRQLSGECMWDWEKRSGRHTLTFSSVCWSWRESRWLSFSRDSSVFRGAPSIAFSRVKLLLLSELSWASAWASSSFSSLNRPFCSSMMPCRSQVDNRTLENIDQYIHNLTFKTILNN